ncbi:zinc finger protein 318 isoform X2 [Syngnathus typhle]|uniref:zinc finger protein 318 isoform X2 n=1 Tax=Syngnathus typhle TaxID=161592 RepID=UPI002A6AFB5F|nr:zinc finger protein 318 isoform X2 [Syngnathus typhle]
MFRGRPSPRGSYGPPFDNCGPPPRLHPRGDERNRARSPHHSDYHHRGHPDYHRPPPHRSYYPPASAGHRGGQHRSAAPPREMSPSPCHRLPVDHKLVITVGNELTSSTTPRQHDRDRSPDRSCIRSSRARSKSRHRSQRCSKSRSTSRGRSRGRASSRASSRAPSRASSHSRRRSTSSSSSSPRAKPFSELEVARRRKEQEESLCLPTKSILKKRSDYERSPLVRTCDSGLSHVAEELLRAVKGMDSAAVASVLNELRSDPQMSQQADFNAEIKEILNLLDLAAVAQEAKGLATDIDDEEKFLYGDSAEPDIVVPPEPLQNHAFDLYGDVTEDVLYDDLLPATIPPVVSPPIAGEVCTNWTPSAHASVSHASEPPPDKESDQQALEDYQKLQNLLKTIGLDLGVTEISKLAARTKERLHGNKMPMRRRTRYSSGSSNEGRSRRSRSSDEEEDDYKRVRHARRAGSWNKDVGSAISEAPQQTAAIDTAAPLSATAVPATVAVPPSYPPSHAPDMLAPSYLSPGYGQYGNFLPYAQAQWPPPLYPPPSLPPTPGATNFPPTPSANNFLQALPYHAAEPQPSALPDPEVKGAVKTPWISGKGAGPAFCQVSEQENNESQKQKVLEERENLRQEREQRMKKKEYLMKELERLRKQQGELLRKKRREKDGHKDPLLQEISLLQEDIMMQISNLRKEHEVAEKKRSEIDKVALILGLGSSDRPRSTSRVAQEAHALAKPDISRSRMQHSPEHQQDGERQQNDAGGGGISLKDVSEANRRLLIPTTPPPEPFEYYDAGNHWCKSCNLTSGSMFDFLNHLHSKTHRKTLDPYERPWASSPTQAAEKAQTEEKLMKPAKGSEFLFPVRGFFCLLCEKFFGDAICAEEHVTTHSHNDNYKKKMHKNPLYEQRRNLDRQAGLASNQTGKKRKHEEDKGEKTKGKKEKKGGIDFGTEVASSKAGQAEERAKVLKRENDRQTMRMSCYARIEEDKLRSKKKSDKCHWAVEEEERPNWRRDEQERHKQSQEGRQYRNHKQEEEQYERRPQHDDRHKLDKHQREQQDKEKNVQSASEQVEAVLKPYHPPKVICGPSLAMRAKLLKQNPDAAKLPATIGKFTWKKRGNQLAKDAQKAAAEFIKDDQQDANDDSFAKSVAFAKEIAQRLSGTGSSLAPWVSSGANPSPVPADFSAPPAAQRRKCTVIKPAALSTGSPFVVRQGSPTPDRAIVPPLERLPETKRDTLNPAASKTESQPGQLLSQSHHLSDPRAAFPASSHTLAFVRPVLTTFHSAPSGLGSSLPRSSSTLGVVRPAPPQFPSTPSDTSCLPGSKPASSASKPTQPVLRPEVYWAIPPPSRPEVNSANPPPSRPEVKPEVNSATPPASKPEVMPEVNWATPLTLRPEVNWATPLPSRPVNPAPQVSQFVHSPIEVEMVDMEPDVAAPGVPESEQTHMVFVKPPPPFSMVDGAQKSDKPKTNLAAAKAQDLFGIFYSSKDKTRPLSLSKSGVVDISETQRGPFIAEPVAHSAAQPSNESPQPNSALPESLQLQSESELLIKSVWSLQTTPEGAPEGVLLDTCVASPHGEGPESMPAHASQTQHVKTCEAKPDDENPRSFPKPLCETSAKIKSIPAPRMPRKTQKKKTPPSSHVPIRQTRSQTRLHHLKQTVEDADHKLSESLGDAEPDLSDSPADADLKLSESAGDADQKLSESAGDADPKLSESEGDSDQNVSESAQDVDQKV